ncbi:HPr kinase/phosphorylase [Roseixanthobacter glucoisosaccharinicivorans]|uniref:HPr kinase/phosphorylase n=1 Tax=Roseixanthobacter glucoisosaccharinicivorans TaxID=3119923 RepID=UPI003729B5F9
MTAPASIHASCVRVGEWGVLIRGPSGSGKSTLALRLILDPPRALPQAELVADDRVMLTKQADGLVAAPPPELAGLIEVRRLGIRRLPHIDAARLHLIVDLGAPEPPRLPAASDLSAQLLGVTLPRIAFSHETDVALMIAAAFRTFSY